MESAEHLVCLPRVVQYLKCTRTQHSLGRGGPSLSYSMTCTLIYYTHMEYKYSTTIGPSNDTVMTLHWHNLSTSNNRGPYIPGYSILEPGTLYCVHGLLFYSKYIHIKTEQTEEK